MKLSEFFENTFKDRGFFHMIWYAVFAALAVAGCWFGCTKYQQYNALKDAKPIVDTIGRINPTLKPVEVYKDTAGRTHVVYANTAGAIINAKDKESYNQLKPKIDSLAALMPDVKPNNIQTITTYELQSKSDSVAFLKRKVDSLNGVIKSVTQTYKNAFLEITAKSGNLTDTTDKGSFSYKYNVKLNAVQYFTQKKLFGFIPFGVKKSLIDLSTDDTSATVMGVKKYTIIQRQPSYGFRVQATANHSFISNSNNVGLGARYDLKHFSFYGAYYYNFKISQFRPTFSVSYDLIRF